jgi:hypothetical protein
MRPPRFEKHSASSEQTGGWRARCSPDPSRTRAALPSRVLQQRGHIPPPEAGAPGILALADRDRLRLLLTEAGFADPAIEEVAFGFRFAGVDDYWGFLNGAAGAIAMVLSRLGEDERERIRREIANQLDAFGGTGEIELPATSLVLSAS